MTCIFINNKIYGNIIYYNSFLFCVRHKSILQLHYHGTNSITLLQQQSNNAIRQHNVNSSITCSSLNHIFACVNSMAERSDRTVAADQDDELYTIEASVVTGFEESARGEAKEKFETEVKAARGKITWRVPLDKVKDVSIQ